MISLEKLEERVSCAEKDIKRVEIALAEIKVMLAETQNDISEIKQHISKSLKKVNGGLNTNVEIKRYEYLLMVGTILLSFFSLITLLMRGLK